MILTRKRLLVAIFSLADYQKYSHFASLQALISSPGVKSSGVRQSKICKSHLGCKELREIVLILSGFRERKIYKSLLGCI